jgi:hypothetical protein
MKRVAILMFGQPRFFKLTAPLIKEEFKLLNTKVDFFGHFWEQTGFIPGDKEESSDLPNTEFFTKLKIEDYTDLKKACESINYFYNNLVANNIKLPIEDNNYLLYRFGQHYSVRECYKLIKKYENKHKFKYDIIIKTRTDLVFRTHHSYSSVKEYYELKNKYYFDQITTNSIKCNALRLLDLSNKINNTGEEVTNTKIHEYSNGKIILNNKSPAINYKETYNIRLCLNDWMLVAGRNAADFYYGCYFENFYITFAKDLIKTTTYKKFISSSEHSLQGQFLLNYNISAKTLPARRDVRLLHKNKIKNDVVHDGKILCDENTTLPILLDDIKHHFRKK